MAYVGCVGVSSAAGYSLAFNTTFGWVFGAGLATAWWSNRPATTDLIEHRLHLPPADSKVREAARLNSLPAGHGSISDNPAQPVQSPQATRKPAHS
jgi:hypothetical protein